MWLHNILTITCFFYVTCQAVGHSRSTAFFGTVLGRYQYKVVACIKTETRLSNAHPVDQPANIKNATEEPRATPPNTLAEISTAKILTLRNSPSESALELTLNRMIIPLDTAANKIGRTASFAYRSGEAPRYNAETMEMSRKMADAASGAKVK